MHSINAYNQLKDDVYRESSKINIQLIFISGISEDVYRESSKINIQKQFNIKLSL